MFAKKEALAIGVLVAACGQSPTPNEGAEDGQDLQDGITDYVASLPQGRPFDELSDFDRQFGPNAMWIDGEGNVRGGPGQKPQLEFRPIEVEQGEQVEFTTAGIDRELGLTSNVRDAFWDSNTDAYILQPSLLELDVVEVAPTTVTLRLGIGEGSSNLFPSIVTIQLERDDGGRAKGNFCYQQWSSDCSLGRLEVREGAEMRATISWPDPKHIYMQFDLNGPDESAWSNDPRLNVRGAVALVL